MHTPLRWLRFVLLAACAFALVPSGRDPCAAEPAASQRAARGDFPGDILPVLMEKCVGCHNPEKREGGLDMSSRKAMLRGGHSGPAYVPGNAGKSLMLELIEFGEMPPRDQQEPRVTEQELEKLRAWVAAERPLNVVFFLVDDLGYMDIGANNPQSFYETPNIDRLAASGMRFTNGYAANPVCSPTRYSIMTGKYPSRIDATNFFSGMREGRFRPAPLNDRMPLEEVTLAEALKEHGYATFFAGKWHLGPDEKFWPENQGFDVNRGGNNRGGPYGGNRYFSPYGNPRLEDGPDGEHLPDRLASETVEFIESHQDEPFFAYLSFYSVHTPLMAREDLAEKYRGKAQRLNLDEQVQFADEEQVWPTQDPRRVRIVQNHAVYAGMVEAMDLAVGKVLDRLEELGLDKETAIIFMADNGGLSTSEGSPTSNLPLRGGKGWLYEGGIREPWLIRWPGVTEPGSVCEVPVISTDFYPTILDMADLPARPHQHLDGVSLTPLLKGGGESTLERDALYWHYPHYSNQGGFPGAAIRMGDWKLIERFEDGRVHLYNLKDDLAEQDDLAEDHPERIADMRRRLHQWYERVDAKFLRAHPDGPQPWTPGPAP